MAYRIPRRFIAPPDEPPPYGLLLVSFLGHAFFLLMAGAISAFVNAQADQSKIYIVNLVPDTAPLGSPTPRVAPPQRPAEERTPPRPEKLETPPPRPQKEPPAPPRAPEVARIAPPRPADLALPRKAEKETPALENPAARERLIERSLPPPPTPAPPARVPEPPRTAPVPPPPAAPPAVATARPGVEPIPLGRPDATTRSTGSISLDVSDFPFTYYLRAIQRKIGDQWTPPRGSTAGGEKVVVLFEIGRDGQIKEPAVERSSGNAIYDQSALRAVVEASPFPPLPADFKASSLKVHFGFEYKPEQG